MQIYAGTNHITINRSSFPVTLKEALKLIGLDCSDCVKPIQPISDKQREKQRGVFQSMGPLH